MKTKLFAILALAFAFTSAPAFAQTLSGTTVEPKAKIEVKELESKTFDKEVKASKTPVLVDFTAWWCGPCQNLKPKLEKLAQEFDGKLLMGKVEVTKEPQLATRFGVRAYPTMKILAPDGTVLSTKTGNLPEADLRKWIQDTIDDYNKAQAQKAKANAQASDCNCTDGCKCADKCNCEK